MKLKLKTGIKIKIDKNESNREISPIGMFTNIPYVLHKGEWFSCSMSIIDDKIKIHSLHKTDPITSTMTDLQKDVEYIIPVGKFKKELIIFLLNKHLMNRRIYNIKKWYKRYKKKVWVFTTTFLFVLSYYFINFVTNNYLMNLIATNLLAQTIFIFLTLSGLINIFFPFTIRDEISEKDAITIVDKSYKLKKEEDENNKRIEDISTL